MNRSLFSALLVIPLFFGCDSKEKAGDFQDPETIVKNEDFRKTIDSGDFVKLSAGYTYYEFENTDADTLLVMVHGFSVPSYIWDSTYYAAAKRGYGVLRYDVYGRGYSDNPDAVYDAALFSGQLLELLDALEINKKINLLGLSYGGKIITAFAFQYPERIQNLIYVDPAGFEDREYEANLPIIISEEDIKEFKEWDGYATMAQGQLGDFHDPSRFAGWDTRYEVLMKHKGFVRALISTRKNDQSMENEHRKIGESGMPVYCFWGEHDTVLRLDGAEEVLTDRIPQLKLFVIPDAAHIPNMEQTQLFNSILFDQIICCEH
ncbi:MAG: alpha/beta hydrolase [Cyclobacteriaceae bacterium]